MPLKEIMNALKRKMYGGFANEAIENEGCASDPGQNHGHSIESEYTSYLEDANKLNRQIAELDQRIKTEMSRLAKIKSDTGVILCRHEAELLIASDILADSREIVKSEFYIESDYNPKIEMNMMVMNIITPDLREGLGQQGTTIRPQISNLEYKLWTIRGIVKGERKAHIEICHSYEAMQVLCLRHMEVMSDIRCIIAELTTMSGESIDQSDDDSAIYLSKDKIMAIKRNLRSCQSEVDSILQELSIGGLVVRDAYLNKPILSNLEREKVEEYLASSRNVYIAPLDAAMDEAEEHIATLANTQSERHIISEVGDLITF